ncbi:MULTISPECIES: amino acid ABC transporter permease [Halobacterium]|uniref:amino acid ABC transporter permease n=1 Tax=Halobacterium TaxID=2239 RepID=UPI00073E61FC|nr:MULTISPECIES: amino acid ABC transporter permease [Halobacterium]MCG1003760.1 amino acid ABC transporter permease [Halobacterium noricense]
MTRSKQRLVRDAILGVFWLWLSVRLLNDWFGGVLAPVGQPFFDPQPVADASAALGEVARGGPLFGGGVADLLDSVLFGWPGDIADLLGSVVFGLVGAVGDALGSVAFAMTYLPDLAAGAWLTVVLTTLGIAFGLVIAVPLAAARVYGRITHWVALAFIELIRGTPLLAQLFVLYYALPLSRWFAAVPFVGSGIVPAQAVWVAVVGFTINSAAYQAEYIRGSIEGVDPGQLTAARAIGLTQFEGIRHVVLPQALRFAIPSWTNELVYLVKYSSLASFITVSELYHAAESAAYANYRFLDLFVLAAVVYVLLVLSATTTMEWVRQRVAIPGVGGSAGGRSSAE